MAKYADKWKKTFPESIGNEIRPVDGVDNTQAYNTDAMPQYMANDPVRFDLQNAINSQLVSNDERLKEKIDKTNVDLSAHDKNPKAHTTGIAGNAASATKLQTARTLALSGKATGSATFDGTANANIKVTAVTADTASKLSTPRTISLGGNATGSANFDGSGNITINTTVNQAAHANNADVATKVNATAPNGGTADLVFGIMANDDSARIRIGGSDNGWLEIATSDNGNEPIYARQYSGSFRQNAAKTVTNEAVLLDGAGNTKFPHNVTATNFVGHLAGNADTATNVAWSGVTGKPNLALKDGDTIYTNDWFRSRGATGWYNESYGGGWYMTDSTWIRAFNNKSVYTPAKMQADGGFYGNLQGNASSANVGKALQVFDGNNKAINSTFHWVGKDGQPSWIWGSNDGSNAYVYNPSNFRVSYATNANSAVNADTVDGYHASDLLRTLGGNRTPVMTDIFDRAGTIDMSTMSATDKANNKAKINKSRNSLQSIWNNTTGIHAYGGDVDMSEGYHRGTLKLTQSYKNFDKILVVGTNDDGDKVFTKLWDVWELAYAFSHSFRFPLYNEGSYWTVYGSVRTGTATNYVLSTDTIWNCYNQNCGIIAIYGVKY